MRHVGGKCLSSAAVNLAYISEDQDVGEYLPFSDWLMDCQQMTLSTCRFQFWEFLVLAIKMNSHLSLYKNITLFLIFSLVSMYKSVLI